jgi:hypothetical protein
LQKTSHLFGQAHNTANFVKRRKFQKLIHVLEIHPVVGFLALHDDPELTICCLNPTKKSQQKKVTIFMIF